MLDEPQTTSEYNVAPAFDHSRNITVGKARVIYVEPAGWALPGRRWTTDRDEAMQCAMAMDRAMRR